MNEQEIRAALEKLQSDLNAHYARVKEETAEFGSVRQATADALENVNTRIDELDGKLAALQEKRDGESIDTILRSNKDLEGVFRTMRDSGSWAGRLRIEIPGKRLQDLFYQRTVTAAGYGSTTAGVMPLEMDTDIVTVAKPTLRMRSVLPARPTTREQIAWIKQTVRPTKASPVEENTLKPSTDLPLTTDFEMVKLIALVTVASNQVLSDLPELLSFINGELRFNVIEEEDRQILFGDATGQNLNGLTTQAQSFDTTLLPPAASGYTFIDTIGAAFRQLAADNLAPMRPFVVVNPGDLWAIRLTKDGDGRFILGDPQSPFAPTIWGAPLVDTSIMPAGSFLVGSGDPRAVEIRDRMGVTIALSTEDGDNFRYNRVTIRAEERVALVVKMPDAFVYGSLAKSPA